jgi:hypothetical protein
MEIKLEKGKKYIDYLLKVWKLQEVARIVFYLHLLIRVRCSCMYTKEI